MVRITSKGRITAAQLPFMAVGDTPVCAVSLDKQLPSGVTIASAIVTEESTAHLSISAAVVTTSEMSINNRTVSAGEGILFSLSGMHADTDYRLKIAFTLSNGEIKNRFIEFKVDEDV